MINFIPMTQSEFDVYRELSVAEYAEDLIKSKIATAEKAYEESLVEFIEILPNGIQTSENYLYIIKNEQNERIGLVWYGRDLYKSDSAFIFDLLIDEKHRRNGYGKNTLAIVEKEAKTKGFTEMGLNVFKFNAPAYTLYQRAGYSIENDFDGNMILRKSL